MPKKTVFIIHGRDLNAKNALARFIKALGLDVLEFESLAAKMGPSPFVASVVLEAVKTADAIIALFTPDEQTILYPPDDPNGALAKPEEMRWQARPNVIFEAGVALGNKPERTILATLGADVSLFSDVHGIHFVRLGESDGKVQLRDRLMRILFPEGGSDAQRGISMGEKTLAAHKRPTWGFFDEAYALAKRMQHQWLGTGSSRRTLFDVLTEVCTEEPALHPREIWPKDIMDRVEERFPELADVAYWRLVMLGFFRFTNEQNWGITRDEDWESSVPFVEFAERGVHLMERIQLQSGYAE
jgi:hypothetical protein